MRTFSGSTSSGGGVAGAVAPPIMVSTHAEAGMVAIPVADHGDGVPVKFAPQLFERFARAECSADHRPEAIVGSCLGLSIVRGCCRLTPCRRCWR